MAKKSMAHDVQLPDIPQEAYELAMRNLVDALKCGDSRIRWSATCQILSRVSPTLKPESSGVDKVLQEARAEEITQLRDRLEMLERMAVGGAPNYLPIQAPIQSAAPEHQAESVVIEDAQIMPAWLNGKG